MIVAQYLLMQQCNNRHTKPTNNLFMEKGIMQFELGSNELNKYS